MFRSHVIDIGGVFAGAAVTASPGYRFIAVDPRVEELDGSQWPSLTEVRRVVGCLLNTGRLPIRSPAFSA
jgi:hypothetical protein